MSLDERVSTLIKRIYHAREDAGEWDAIAEDILRCTGAHAALSTVVDLSNREYNSTRFYGTDGFDFERVVTEYADLHEEDPSLKWASAHPYARFCDSSHTLPGEDYLSHPFIRWNRSRLGSTHWYVGYTPPEDHLSYSFSVHFPAEQGAGRKESLRLFRTLFDHMDCAHRLSSRPFNAASSRPLVLLDGDGTLRELTVGAERTLAVSDGLSVRDRRLTTALPAEQQVLDAALASVAAATETGTASVAVKVSRPSGQRAWILSIRPLISGYGPFSRMRCNLLVQIHDGAPHIGSLHLVQNLFDLTERELQVLRLLIEGQSVESFSRHLNISSNTARAHLRAIFAKTATSRQSEVVQLCTALSNS